MPSLPNGESFWAATVADSQTTFPQLDADLEVDVAIVGAGIVGLTAAVLLQRAGRRVAVLEALKVGLQVTGRSTAKITSQHRLIYHTLERSFGEDGARAYAAANEAGLAQILRFAREFGIESRLQRKDAYVYSRSGEQLAEIEKEVEVARRLGLPASFVRECSLPFGIAGALRFADQAQFNPCEYLRGLAATVRDGGGQIFEGTRAGSIEHGEPCSVVTDEGVVRAREVIDAAHMPLGGEGKFFAKASPYAHPMVAGRIRPERAPDGMFISAGKPTRSLRTADWRGEVWLLAVGNSYKPGDPDAAEAALEDLAAFLNAEFELRSLDYAWTNEDYQSMDGMPFVGRATGSTPHLYVATGFNAWGITNGTAAGMILSDLILGRSNPWAEAFDATRTKPLAAAKRFVGENAGTAARMVGGHLQRGGGAPADLCPGEAAVLKLEDERVAIFRDDDGRLHGVSAVCTHMGCVLGWNPVDRTWDCSCHGSRFGHDGRVIHGPATTALERRPVS